MAGVAGGLYSLLSVGDYLCAVAGLGRVVGVLGLYGLFVGLIGEGLGGRHETNQAR